MFSCRVCRLLRSMVLFVVPCVMAHPSGDMFHVIHDEYGGCDGVEGRGG